MTNYWWHRQSLTCQPPVDREPANQEDAPRLQQNQILLFTSEIQFNSIPSINWNISFLHACSWETSLEQTYANEFLEQAYANDSLEQTYSNEFLEQIYANGSLEQTYANDSLKQTYANDSLEQTYANGSLHNNESYSNVTT